MSEDGLEAIYRLPKEGIKTNCTLIFTANQGLLAAKAGASLLSPFVGRLDDINQDGMEVIRELPTIVQVHDLDSEVLAASIRHPRHVTEARCGSHIATLPFKVLSRWSTTRSRTRASRPSARTGRRRARPPPRKTQPPRARATTDLRAAVGASVTLLLVVVLLLVVLLLVGLVVGRPIRWVVAAGTDYRGLPRG